MLTLTQQNHDGNKLSVKNLPLPPVRSARPVLVPPRCHVNVPATHALIYASSQSGTWHPDLPGPESPGSRPWGHIPGAEHGQPAPCTQSEGPGPVLGPGSPRRLAGDPKEKGPMSREGTWDGEGSTPVISCDQPGRRSCGSGRQGAPTPHGLGSPRGGQLSVRKPVRDRQPCLPAGRTHVAFPRADLSASPSRSTRLC